jgi:signal transduction protein with GAF and PtsI domain
VTAVTPSKDGIPPRTDAGEPDTDAGTEICTTCAAKQVLTKDEEIILGRMREIKEEARRLTERMNEIQVPVDAALSGKTAEGEPEEWSDIFGTLEDLRNQWRDWQRRLDRAVERKLIALGHREP